jgi:hypothetical protein
VTHCRCRPCTGPTPEQAGDLYPDSATGEPTHARWSDRV